MNNTWHTFFEFPVVVEYDVHMASPMTRDYPGDDGGVEVYSVTAYGVELYHVIPYEDIARMEDEIKEYLDSQYEAECEDGEWR